MRKMATVHLMTRGFKYYGPFVIIVVTLLAISPLTFSSPGKDGTCITCHEGIELISENKIKANLPCTSCHQGNDKATSQEDAHQGLWANPTDYRIVEKTCGTCHEKVVKDSKKSLHATMAGQISGTRYTWGLRRPEMLYMRHMPLKIPMGKSPQKRVP